jgi:hypothetical protein
MLEERHLRKRRLGNVQEKQKSQLGFVSSDGTNGNKDAGGTYLEVVLSNGRRIKVWPDFHSDTLERLLIVLEKDVVVGVGIQARKV